MTGALAATLDVGFGAFVRVDVAALVWLVAAGLGLAVVGFAAVAVDVGLAVALLAVVAGFGSGDVFVVGCAVDVAGASACWQVAATGSGRAFGLAVAFGLDAALVPLGWP